MLSVDREKGNCVAGPSKSTPAVGAVGDPPLKVDCQTNKKDERAPGQGAAAGLAPGAAGTARANHPGKAARNSPGSGSGGGHPVYAALDLGTNNCRLLVALPARQGFRVIDAFSRIIRLGEGLSQSGRLSEAAILRTIEALKVCRDKMANRGVQRSRVIATEACRAAENADEFLSRVEEQAGLSLEIVSRETEARLAVSGCASLLDRSAEGAIIFDIGGGSSEIAWVDLQPGKRCCPLEAQRRIRAWTSLPVGVVTLAERFGGIDVTPALFEAMVGDVQGRLADFEAKNGISATINGRNVHMVGTSGTVTTIAGVHLALPRYERSRVDGCWLSAGQVREVTDRLVSMSYADRVANPCIGVERADLVLAGCAILEAIRRQWTCARLRVADRGLREGILATLMAEDGNLRGMGVRNRRRRRRHPRRRQAAG